ncbi:Asp23/Gls24 family envelope stress response protein [Alkaliphilus pronyensis]|uniref:Asp23/Gls24 family envelope stress response protein n=2 Tax=Alkaliphilus pronyensis TaxID=1482732 RepID=A0A6I0FH62_9FIRM|nr:Asp23/Gls24 family envelope stress response protein [Alkaliphilus pronyensis]
MELQGQQGKIKIASDVIMVITKKAVEEVEGIVSFTGGISKGASAHIGKDNPRKAVNVANEKKNVIINLSVVIKYGDIIPEVVKEVQEKVKTAIEAMTEIHVETVNIFVQDVKIN